MSVLSTLEAAVEGGPSSSKPFELIAGPFPCSVISVRGREALSELFAFDVTLAAPVDAPLFEMGTLGLPAQLTMNASDGPPRVVQGIASRVRRVSTRFALRSGSHDAGYGYRLRIVPVMWQLTRRTNSRVFQDMTVPDIVTKVLGEHGVAFRKSLLRTYVTRGYCVQYEETDYKFVARLLAEAGILFYFDPPSSLLGGGAAAAAVSALGDVAAAAGVGDIVGDMGVTETVVLCDTAAGYTAVGAVALPLPMMATSEDVPLGPVSVNVLAALGPPPPTLVFRSADGYSVAKEHVHDFEIGRAVASRAVLMRDYDFRRPLFDVVGKANVADAMSLSVDVSPAGLGAIASGALGVGAITSLGAGLVASAGGEASALLGGGAPGPSPTELAQVYVHHGEYDQPDFDTKRAGVVLEQVRRKAVRGSGAGFWQQMSAGRTFVLDEHPTDTLNRPYVLCRVEHEGRDPEWGSGEDDDRPVYENRFVCAFAEVAVRPKRPKRRVRQSMETATVVGPPGEEIHTDSLGRIKVQFPWDLGGKHDDHSSCWIRVSQAWAGAGWGFQFVPRVGMEVLVGFAGGDPDRPIVLGCLHNGTHLTSDPLPARKTRSGIRSQSSPGGGGGNEIAFEDQAGDENLVLHAQKDMTEEVNGDRKVRVGQDRLEHVIRDVRLTIGGARTDSVVQEHRMTVGADRIVTVGGEEQVTVTGPQTLDAGDDQTTRVGGDQSLEVIGERSVLVRDDAREQIHGDRSSYVFGEETRVVWHDGRLVYGKACGVSVSTDLAVVVGTASAPGRARTTVNGDATTMVAGTAQLTFGKSLVIRVGDKNKITIDDDGVKIESPAIRLVAGTIDAASSKARLTLDDNATMSAKTAKVFTSDGAILDLSADAKLDGQSLELNCKNSARMTTAQKKKEETKDLDKISVTLFDRRGKVIDGAPYEVSCQGYLDSGKAPGGIVKIPDLPDADECQVRWARPMADRKAEIGESTEELPEFEFEMDVYLKFDAADDDENLLRKLHNLGHQGPPEHAMRSFYAANGIHGGAMTLADIKGEIESRHGSLQPIEIETGGEA